MNSRSLSLAAALTCAAAAIPAVAQPCKERGGPTAAQIVSDTGAPLLAGLGDHTYSISTASPLAQRYFNQGLTMHYAFNHREAVRAFRHASELDPLSPMTHWGIALSLGPHVNKPMDAESVPAAWQALGRAQSLAVRGTPIEQALIGALAARYAAEHADDRSALDVAYADAMRRVVEQFPDDLDAATLFAEAVMCTMPWDYWQADDTPRPPMREVLAALERVLAGDPKNPGANHLYIHAVEAGPSPALGLAAADRLRDLCPAAGHLVHMPAHIYLRVGLYHEASRANELALAADETYISQCAAQGFYPLAYYPHNFHFLWFSSCMEGRFAAALDAAQRIVPRVTDDYPEADRLRPMVWFTLVRFGKWDDLARERAPDAKHRFASAMWDYVQALRASARGDLPAAERHAATLAALTQSDEGRAFELPMFYGHRQLQTADLIVKAAIAYKSGEASRAVEHLRAAVEVQDSLPYMEPPYWYYPVRQALAEVLLRSGLVPEAEAEFRRDLHDNPSNGWSLRGLEKTLRAQGKESAADEVRERFAAAWLRADSEPDCWPF